MNKTANKTNRLKNTSSALHNQAGLGLASAIFIITILALLAAGIASLVANSSHLHTQQILSIRADSAAHSGLNIYLASTSKGNACQAEQANYTFNTQGLYDCKAQVSCDSTKRKKEEFLLVTSKGSCGSGIDSANSVVEKYLLQ